MGNRFSYLHPIHSVLHKISINSCFNWNQKQDPVCQNTELALLHGHVSAPHSLMNLNDWSEEEPVAFLKKGISYAAHHRIFTFEKSKLR